MAKDAFGSWLNSDEAMGAAIDGLRLPRPEIEINTGGRFTWWSPIEIDRNAAGQIVAAMQMLGETMIRYNNVHVVFVQLSVNGYRFSGDGLRLDKVDDDIWMLAQEDFLALVGFQWEYV